MAGLTPILIIAATKTELDVIPNSVNYIKLVTGIGPAATAMSVVKAIGSYSPALILQIGIAGAITTNIPLEQVVYVVNDKFGDMGVYRDDKFSSFDNTSYKSNCALDIPFQKVSGVTVSTACSSFADRSNCHIESMEGAAFYMAAQQFNVPAIQLRSISNYLDTPRSEWHVEQAIKNLAPAVRLIIDMWLSAK